MNSCITSEHTDHKVLEVVNYIAEALQKTSLNCSSELGPPANFSVLQWVATGPHKLAIAHVVLWHICNPKGPQARLEQLNLTKTDPSMWS
jgi:hypothetical protein